MERHILIVDDEINILNALERLLDEHDDLVVHRASSGMEGLEVIDQHPQISVVLSDQRMPNMTGIEFLKQVKARYNNVVRMILSGYSELSSITQAINEGSIFKFLTKPWDEDTLLNNIREAFEYYELAEKNRKLTRQLQETNHKLEEFNAGLERLVEEKTHKLQLHVASLRVYQEAIERFPFAVIGLDNSRTIVLENAAARREFAKQEASLLGLPVDSAFKEEWLPLELEICRFSQEHGIRTQTVINHNTITLVNLGSGAQSVGQILITTPIGE
ncbi:MAG: response regulator [Pseudomonadales bacterium]|nr:response regulator [Pseudomonadales bacterium]